MALLYAYSTAENYTNSEDNPNEEGNPIKLVISEAGPTYFALSTTDPNPICNNDIQAMVGSNNAVDLYNASPLTYAVGNNSPYTILAYGNGLSAKYENYEGNNGDDTIPYSQAQALETQLLNNGVQYALYQLYGVNHNQFGEGSGKAVYPNTTYDNKWGVNEIIDDYYEEISNKLQELAQQED